MWITRCGGILLSNLSTHLLHVCTPKGKMQCSHKYNRREWKVFTHVSEANHLPLNQQTGRNSRCWCQWERDSSEEKGAQELIRSTSHLSCYHAPGALHHTWFFTSGSCQPVLIAQQLRVCFTLLWLTKHCCLQTYRWSGTGDGCWPS